MRYFLLKHIKRGEINKFNTYILQIRLNRNMKISVGRLGDLYFKKGYYLYTGSAKRNFFQRIKRHLERKKNKFWHIDYLLSCNYSRIKKIWQYDKDECQLANELLRKKYSCVDRSGSSDCKCLSHLFFLKDNSEFKLKGFKRIF